MNKIPSNLIFFDSPLAPRPREDVPNRDPGRRIGLAADIFITVTGNKDVITVKHMSQIKGIERINIKPQYDEWVFPDGHSVMILAEGRLMNLGCATGHPSFVMSASFTNQVMAQMELHESAEKYEKKVYTLPKALDEKVARLHLEKLGVKLTRMTDAQAAYLGVPMNGPYKPDHYRY